MGRPPEALPQEWAKVVGRAGLVDDDGQPSLKALRQAAGMSASTLWRVIKDKNGIGGVTDANVAKLANALKMKPEEVQALVAPELRTKVALAEAELRLVEYYRNLTEDARDAIDRQVNEMLSTRRAR